ncbi:acyl carrier protein [Flavobacterium arcticum]|uniref:Acyl carrier protein n=1 Tax=Flavobacterium arcticum TaxID=1784713 RepID=A0A345H986_9FLAO|nr:acyl carrier protein [Flavobacterium arcticum]AXG73146.1 acyl carrier protein [Flavobacterium arcticum]KAF2512938.1 acyl carrier protein [Flavobacterium arcticum]
MENKFIEALKEALEMEDQEINFDDNFRDYDTWDSLSRLSLIAVLDEEFEVQIEDAKFEKLITVKDLYEAVVENK